MKKLGKLLRALLIGCGVLFVIILLLPDDTGEPSASQGQTTIAQETTANEIESPFTEEMVKEKQANIKGDGSDIVTVLVYMNGSDLESEGAAATQDLCEMLAADISSQVNVLVETAGTKSWSKRLGIASDHTQRYKAESGKLVLVDGKVRVEREK